MPTEDNQNAEERQGPPKRSLFGNYEIFETVGQGGMGIVYRAQDVTLDRIVALKVLREDLRESAGVVARFRREGEAFASLNHPNIVHIYSVGAVGKIPYIAMEFIDGDPLSRVLKRERRVEWKRALHIAEQIAEALASAHDALIIHRDIKPGNILLDKEGHAFVTDFGIAKVLTAETQLTVDGTRLGTPQYMSPERCQNGEVIAVSDIYSLGVVLFQLISGKLPYDAETPVSLVRQITHDPPKRLRDYAPDVPVDVERLVAFMLEKNPKDRPQDAHSLALLIARVRAGKPIEEGDSGLRAALNEMRDAMTPTPTSYFDSASTSFDNIPLVARLRKQWHKTSDSAKIVFYSAIIIALAALAGMGIASRLNQGYAIDLVQRMEPGAEKWQQSATVAQYVDESSGVMVARVALSDFGVTNTAWTSRGTLAVEIAGKEGTARAGQHGMLVFHPYRRVGTILVPPIPASGGTPALTLFSAFAGQSPGSAWDGAFAFQFADRAPAINVWRPAGALGLVETFLSSPQLATAFNLDDVTGLRIADAVLGPLGQRMALVAQLPGAGGWRIFQSPFPGDEDGAFRFQGLTEAGTPIDAFAYAPDAAWLAYLRRIPAGGHELWTSPTDVFNARGTKIAAGNLSLGPGAIHPTARRIALVTAEAPGLERIEIIDADSGDVEANLGAGAAVAWHPSGQFLVAAARDHKGEFQLWRIGAEPPHDRGQLTFLEGGTAPQCAIAQDGAFACSAGSTATHPFVVFVELPRI